MKAGNRRWSGLGAGLVGALIVSTGVCGVGLLGTVFIVADWMAGNGGELFLLGWLGYQAVLLGLPIAGLVVMSRRRNLAMVLQIAWLVSVTPVLVFLIVSATRL